MTSSNHTNIPKHFYEFIPFPGPIQLYTDFLQFWLWKLLYCNTWQYRMTLPAFLEVSDNFLCLYFHFIQILTSTSTQQTQNTYPTWLLPFAFTPTTSYNFSTISNINSTFIIITKPQNSLMTSFYLSCCFHFHLHYLQLDRDEHETGGVWNKGLFVTRHV